MKKIISNIITILILIVAVVIIVASMYYKNNYADQTFDILLYHLSRGTETGNLQVIWTGVKACIIPVVISFLVVFIPLTSFGNNKSILDIKFKGENKSFQLYPNKRLIKHKVIYGVIILCVCIVIALKNIGLYTYIKRQSERTEIFDEEYVASENVKITFPEEKRNLIYIFLESMETSMISKEDGGGWEYTVIPELKKLAEKNINFSNTEKLGGAYQLTGTGWTVAGMTAQTAGIPLKMDISSNDYSGYESFLPGVHSLGDILKKEGYNLELMVGSDATFGGRKDYFKTHGDYEIFDVNTAIEEGKMKKEDYIWWGYDDDDLFKWAKEEILELAKKEEPFNFMMLTVDTHWPDGYLSENVGNKFETQYENVFAYSSKSVSKFIEWIKKQDFYDNTTIVIVGDHLGMQPDFYEKHLDGNYVRTTFNAFINSAIPESNSKKREFSTLDMFPTVLASMGVKIEGDRLGLGTNLFSGKETLIEKYGFEYVNNELAKKSNYYNQYLLKDDYLQMLENIEESNTIK